MAIGDEQKLDYLWKKVVYGVTKTDINVIKAAVNESITSSAIVRGDTIWTDSYLIPDSLPDFNTDIVRVYSDSGLANPTVECVPDLTATPNRTWLTNLQNWIPSEFGSTYLVKVYVDDEGSTTPQTTGTQLFASGSGNNDEWFFDSQPGVLNFIGNNLPSQIEQEGKSIFIVGARYVGDIGLRGDDGLLGDIKITDNEISTITNDRDIVLKPNGAGKIVIESNLKVSNNLDVSGAIDAGSITGGIDGGFF